MKYMFLIYSSEDAWTQDEWTQCTKDSSDICHELAEKGQFISASPLHPISMATSVRVREGKRQMVLREMKCASYKSRISWTRGCLREVWQTTQAQESLKANWNTAIRPNGPQHVSRGQRPRFFGSNAFCPERAIQNRIVEPLGTSIVLVNFLRWCWNLVECRGKEF